MSTMSKKSGKYNFGGYGWSMVIFAFIAYFNYVGLTGDGMNLLLQGFSDTRGFDMATLLSINTPTALISIVATLVLGWVIGRKGVRFVVSLCYIATGILVLVWCRVTTLPMYTVIITLIFATTVGYSHLTAAPLINNWFVNKRQMAFGISSIGLNICTCLVNPMLQFLFSRFGFVNGLTIYGVALIVLGIASVFWVKNKPEDVGRYIDNDPESSAALAKEREALANVKTEWTFKKCLKCKQVWLCGFIFGLHWFATMGFVSQIIPHLVTAGFTQNFAMWMMSLSAIIGCASSWIWGLIDEKFGARKATVALSLFYVLPFTLLCFPTVKAAGILGTLAAGWILGGQSTLMPSFMQELFGRDEVMVPYKYALTLNMILKSFSFLVLAASLVLVGTYSLAYGFFALSCVVAAILCKFCDPKKRVYASDIK